MNINQLTAKEIKFYSKRGGSFYYKGLSMYHNGEKYRLFTGRYNDLDNTSYKTLKELKKAIQTYLYN